MPIRRKQKKTITDPELASLFVRYEKGTKLNDRGGLTFKAFPDAVELEHILADAFEADSNITDRQLRSLLRTALRTCRRNAPITVDGLLVEVRGLAQGELSKPKKQFTIWTKFRAKQMAFSKGFRLRWNGVWLEATNKLPHKFHLQEYFFDGHGHICPEEPNFYGYLIGRCEARTEEQAVERILDATDIFMAVFNIYELRDGSLPTGKPRAEGKLWHGPYHFVFGDEVFLGNEHIWFDAEFDIEGWETFPPGHEKRSQATPHCPACIEGTCQSSAS